jgi:TPR repeat protein
MLVVVARFVVLAAVLATAGPAAADRDAGEAAFRRHDYATALHELAPSARAGDAAAQYMIGEIRCGGGELRDYRAAAAWFAKAAMQGHALSQFNLGFLYYYGAGTGPTAIAPDPTRAGKWLLLAAQQDIAMAQYLVGTLYRDGRGLPRDRGAAARWTRAAADNGIAAAQYDLALISATGVEAPEDRIEALKWFTVLAEDRYPGAAENRDRLTEALSPADRVRAQRLARDWRAAFLARPDIGPHGELTCGE